MKKKPKRKGVPGACRNCGILLRKNAKFTKHTYSRYLGAPHWQSIRKWALERAEYKCEQCGSDEGTLHVHHFTYERVGHEHPRDVTVLCASCHEEWHERNNVEKSPGAIRRRRRKKKT